MNTDLIVTQAVIAYVVVGFIQWLKKASWFPWLTIQTDKVNRIVGAVLAFFTSIGVVVSFDASVGTLMITGLTLTALWTFIAHFVGQFVGQQYVYKTAFKPSQDDLGLSVEKL